MAGRLFLHAHPDLPLVQIGRSGMAMVLLGYVIDPDNPEFGDHDIMRRLLAEMDSPRDAFRLTARLGGRWILILDNERETILFTDTCGLRQIFHTRGGFPETWCASQPGIVAEELGLELDARARKEFMRTHYFQNDLHRWWPGSSCRYQQIEHLLPNHYLDLKTRTTHRFWPWERLRTVPFQQGAAKGCALLKGLMKAAAARFGLALSVTAGIDTRVILAASKDQVDSAYCFTCTWSSLPHDSRDKETAARLLSELGVDHHVIECPPTMADACAGIYRQNVAGAHEAWGPIVQGLYRHLPRDRVFVKGACSEAAKCFFYPHGYPGQVTAQALMRMTGMDDNALAARHFQTWLDGAQGVEARYGVKVLDLFYWENKDGNWEAQSQLEWDIAHETFSPFNCRELLTTLLGVDMKARRPPRPKLYVEMAKTLWPEVLSVPTNPIPFRNKLANAAKALLGNTIVFRIGRRAYVTAERLPQLLRKRA